MRAVAVVAMACLIVGCSSDPTSSSEYADLEADRDALVAKVESAVDDAEQAADKSGELEAKLAESTARIEEAEQAAEQAAGDLADREAELASATDRVDELEPIQASYEDLVNAVLESWFALSPVDRRCVTDGLAADASGRDEFTKLLFSSEDISDDIPAFAAVVEGCGLDLDDLVSPGVMEGDAYGDNPELDALQDLCAGGDGKACDDLYFASAVGSEYERFAATCGDRFEDEAEHAGFCEGTI